MKLESVETPRVGDVRSTFALPATADSLARGCPSTRSLAQGFASAGALPSASSLTAESNAVARAGIEPATP